MSDPTEFTCRTCMANGTKEEVVLGFNKKIEVISIFNVPDNAKANLSILEIIKLSIPQLTIEEDDMLPKCVCLECSEKIQEFFDFQQKCLETEQKFYEMVKGNNAVINQDNCSENGVYVVKTEINESFQEMKAPFDVNDHFSDDNVSNKSSGSVWSNSNNCNWKQAKNQSKSKATKKKTVPKNGKIDRKANKKDSMASKKEASSKTSTKRSKTTLANEMYPCDKCQRRLKSKLSLIKHQEMHNKKDKEEQELECTLCDMKFSDSSSLRIHQRTHNVEKSFLCSECGKGFASAGSLKQHSLRHMDKKMYSCSDCPKSFRTKTDLLCHFETHKAKPRIHICDICGRGFYKPFLLKQHKRYHNNERPFACEFCEKCFVTSEKQRRHMRIHTGEKPYRCKYCERAFTQSNDCIKHMKQHLGDNVYQCELCPLRFPLARDLRAHFASHKNDDEETRARNLEARDAEEKNLQIKLRENGFSSI